MNLFNRIKTYFSKAAVPAHSIDYAPPKVTVSELKIQPKPLDSFVAPAPISAPISFNHNSVPYFSSGYVHPSLEFGDEGQHWGWKTSYAIQQFNRPILSWREENKIAASKLLEEYGDALALFYDNSFAAQIMILAFADAGTVPRVYAVRFSDLDQPMEALTKLYLAHSFELRLIDADSTMFWKNMTATVISENIISAKEAVNVWAMTSAGGVPVLPGMLPVIQRGGSKLQLGDHEQYFIADRIARMNYAPVIPSFFRYTPEQFAAFLGLNVYWLDQLNSNSSFEKEEFILSEQYPELILKKDPSILAATQFESLARSQTSGGISIYWQDIKPASTD